MLCLEGSQRLGHERIGTYRIGIHLLSPGLPFIEKLARNLKMRDPQTSLRLNGVNLSLKLVFRAIESKIHG